MIELKEDTRLAQWFVWSCDHLPLTVTHEYPKDENGTVKDIRRAGAYYLKNGTTLCHVFWACLWVPMAVSAFTSGVLFVFGLAHYVIYQGKKDTLGIAGLFVPEMVMLGIAAVAGVIILAIIGGEKVGFFKLLWVYLKAIKERICPLVQFQSSVR